jgi:deoxyribodipyrimidine photo-lyase
MRELWETGWMHNRVRMITASFLVKHLLHDWVDGVRWFWDTLVDADLANNTLGWQWTAGCGADAAPYFRVFNPILQGKKFDPVGTYVKRWLPELKGLSAGVVHTPWETEGHAYVAPVIEHSEGRARALAAFEGFKSQRKGLAERNSPFQLRPSR